MTSETPRYVFGPVPSRRLGRSLGVDLVPFKTCSHDCVYCQLGGTTNKTLERAEYAPVDAVVEQVRAALTGGDPPDSVTLAGSGEPTLHRRIGEVIAAIRRLTDVPITILTNGSLFGQVDVRQACARADRVLPSLDAGSEEVFQCINRPAAGLTLARHVEGLVAFRSEFSGELWLEIMIVEGVNASDDELGRIRSLAERIRPDRIQLNTVIRPPTEESAQPVGPERMAEIRRMMGPLAEVITDYRRRHEPAGLDRRREDVLAILERRPCTPDDVASGLGIRRNEALEHLDRLLDEGVIRLARREEQDYYQAGSREAPGSAAEG